MNNNYQLTTVYNEISSQDINKEHENGIYRHINDLEVYLEDIKLSSDLKKIIIKRAIRNIF